MALSDVALPGIRRGLKLATAWRTVTEILRDHPAMDLRVIETHPGGGTYDCITLVRGEMPDLVCSFNLEGTSVLLGAPIGSTRSRPEWMTTDEGLLRYPEGGLGENRRAIADAIQARLGFPAAQPQAFPGCAQDVALAVMATVVERVALGHRGVSTRNAWADGVGLGGVSIRRWAEDLPGVRASMSIGEWRALARGVCRYWSIDRELESENPAVVLDVATAAVWVRGGPRQNLADGYRAGAGIRALAWVLEVALD